MGIPLPGWAQARIINLEISMSVLSQLVAGYEIPRMARIRQKFPGDKIADPAAQLRRVTLESGYLERIKPGQTVAVALGSRGIANCVPMYRELISLIKERGAQPFIFPAMGSHGGATAEGQVLVLKSLGLTEESCGCPIRATMETVVLGRTEAHGIPVNVDKYAASADALVIINRIKPHTSFRGPVESGLAKMTVIGVGKQKGADQCHSFSMRNMSANIMEMSDYIYRHMNVAFGIGILENAYDETSEIVCLAPEEILSREPELLKRAFQLMPQIYFPKYDVLILDEMGKNIAGPGMDCNIVSRYPAEGIPPDPRQTIITVLDISEQSHGNAHGMGLANIATKRFFDKIDFTATYANPLTALSIHSFAMPMILESDKVAIQASIKFCVDGDRSNPKIIRAKNTLKVSELMISEALLPEAEQNPKIEILSEPECMSFDENGNLF